MSRPAKFLSFSLLLLFGCNSVQTVFEKELPPYEAYVQSLEKAELLNSRMSQVWLEAGQEALRDSVFIDLPFTEAGFFDAAEPEAHSYQFSMNEGQVLTIESIARMDSSSRLFVDLFVLEENQWRYAKAADSTLRLVKEFDRNTRCLLRVQPELLADVYYSIHISTTPSLINPVSGANNRSIRSFYGDTREGGRRSHEGVDIFAPKGTPVVAPTHGFVADVGTNRLGGKVVWMRDSKRGHSYYFAHLDSQLVVAGQRVQQGDTLGLVGNTGNARTTPPHLHFGIYRRGSKDPLNYIRQIESLVETARPDTTFQVLAFRVASERLNLRSGPSTNHEVIRVLGRDHYVKVLGRSGSWFRVSLPDQRQGFVSETLVTPVQPMGDSLIVENGGVILTETDTSSVPLLFLAVNARLAFLARFEEFSLVQTEEGLIGWIRDES